MVDWTYTTSNILDFNGKKPDAWGNRVRVRIMGYHPQNTQNLKMKIFLGQQFFYQQQWFR